MNSITQTNNVLRRNLQNKIFPLLKNSLSISRSGVIRIKSIDILQKRNISILLDQNPYLAQETFFSQHRPLVLNKVKLEIKTVKSDTTSSTVEPVPFSKTISSKKCDKYDDMGYTSGSTSTDSSIAAAWDILDCLFTGHTSSIEEPNNNVNNETSSSDTIQPLKSICEDTYLSYINANDDLLSQEDDIDIDILFSQLTKNSKIYDSPVASPTKNTTSNDVLTSSLSTSSNTSNTTTSSSSSSTSSSATSTTPLELKNTNIENNNLSISTSTSSSTSSTSPKQTTKSSCISKSIMEVLKK